MTDETKTVESVEAKLAESEARVNKILTDHEQEKTTWAQTETSLKAELAKQQELMAELAGLKTQLSEKSSLLAEAQGQISALQEQIKSLTPPAGTVVVPDPSAKSKEEEDARLAALASANQPKRKYRLL